MTTIHVTASRDYDVLVQPGLLDDAGAQIAQVLGTGRTAAIVSGETGAVCRAARGVAHARGLSRRDVSVSRR